MRAIVVDASGNILRTITSRTSDGLRRNIGAGGGVSLYVVPDGHANIHDGKLTAPGGVLTLRSGADPKTAHAGEALITLEAHEAANAAAAAAAELAVAIKPIQPLLVANRA